MQDRQLHTVRTRITATALSLLATMALMPPAIAAAMPAPLTPQQAMARARNLLDLGRTLFHTTALSGTGRMSCATCHDPAHGFTPANTLAVQPGGADLKHSGFRAVPTLKYLQAIPAFTEHYMGAEEDGAGDGVDNGPTGGLTWDGRVTRGRDQARIPLLSADEMANSDSASVSQHVLAAGYGPALQRIYGPAILQSPDDIFDGVTEALEAYEQDPPTFFPYSSRYDAYLNDREKLTPAELRGLAIFNDPARGNCAICHKSGLLQTGGHPDFTDFGFIALGVPRNSEIPRNQDPHYFDLGLCGPARTDLATHEAYCGTFRTPTLRNVALKQRFFHNGYAHTLREAVAFYAERDVSPEKYYPRNADGKIEQYDDLPAPYRANVNREMPFGAKRILSTQDVDDVVAFLGTLTDSGTDTLP
jgi:cytochrome c peroxidase